MFNEWLKSRNLELYSEISIERHIDICNLLEFKNLEDIPTDHIELSPEDTFDEDEANDDCRIEANDNWDYRESEYNSRLDHEIGYIYSDPDEDPDFDIDNPEDWKYENPSPEDLVQMNKDHFDNQEEFEQAEEEWEKDLEDHTENYQNARDEWESEMEQIKQDRDDKMEEWKTEYIDDHINDCVDSRREDYEQNNAGGNLNYSWTHDDGEEYSVGFEKETGILPDALGGDYIDDVWTILFSGPKGHSTTKKDTGMFDIYSELISAVKKLYQTEDVNGFAFSAAEPGMALVYNKFFTRYMKDFESVDTGLFVKKSLIQDILNDMTPEEQENYQKHLRDRGRINSSYIKQVRKDKADLRFDATKLRSLVGKPLVAKSTKTPLVLISVNNENPNKGTGIYLYKRRTPSVGDPVDGVLASSEWITNGDIDHDTQLAPYAWKTFLTKLKEKAGSEVKSWDRQLKNHATMALSMPEIQALSRKYGSIPNPNNNLPTMAQAARQRSQERNRWNANYS